MEINHSNLRSVKGFEWKFHDGSEDKFFVLRLYNTEGNWGEKLIRRLIAGKI